MKVTIVEQSSNYELTFTVSKNFFAEDLIKIDNTIAILIGTKDVTICTSKFEQIKQLLTDGSN
jgi:hypothetical protein